MCCPVDPGWVVVLLGGPWWGGSAVRWTLGGWVCCPVDPGSVGLLSGGPRWGGSALQWTQVGWVCGPVDPGGVGLLSGGPRRGGSHSRSFTSRLPCSRQHQFVLPGPTNIPTSGLVCSGWSRGPNHLHLCWILLPPRGGGSLTSVSANVRVSETRNWDIPERTRGGQKTVPVSLKVVKGRGYFGS